MAISVTHAFVSPVADAGNPDEVGPNEWNAAHTISGLGTAAEADSTDFATAAQGALADSAVQPGDVDALVSANADVAANTAARHAAVTVTDSAEINFTLVGQDITASLVAASIDESKLDASVNASLDLADSALQASAIGVSVQAYDADLTTWAGLTPSANAQSLVTAANYAAMRALLDLEAGTDFYSIAAADAAFQPKDADLTSWAGVTRASGFDTFVATPTSANLQALVTDETGTAGSLVFSASPTFTGTLTAATIAATGLSVSSASAFQPQVAVRNNANDANSAYFMVRKSRGVSDTAVQVSDTLGTFMFQGVDSTPTLKNAAYLTAIVESVSAGSVAARFELVASSSVWQFKTDNNMVMPGDLYRGANKVVGARATGWGAATGTATRTTFATGSVTTAQLAERVKALIDDLIAHGLIGA